ncbi:NUDIX hydrolase [Cryobacterium sp. TMS1-20-1]|uniref:NUDIX hydrolase n=1 Tax=Cryobacterium sp. TMS1-20-1 TaxID=1259223 RepID=UPI00106D572F|nr:NUDIX hydrolase [Cryobacterium sp. TMS1-20-1]TFC71314.1 NUDIX hydrolase [Cryobacterium sp. TMS1-20-1]
MTRDAQTGPVPIGDGASPAAPLGVAATVVLLRDGAEGPEVLLLERPRHRGSFAGAWVFPGGGVDPEDRLLTDAADIADVAASGGSAATAAEGAEGMIIGADAGDSADSDDPIAPAPAEAAEAVEQLAARRAAVREVREETGLTVSPDALVSTALWIPPPIAPKRMRTWFYLTAAPAGIIVLAEDEVIDYAWLRPAIALERHASAVMTLVAPTWVTLHGLQGFESVAAIVAHFTGRGLAHYETRLGASERGQVLFWAGDVAYDDQAHIEQEGGRHRLEIGQVPWVYTASDRA